MKITLRKGETFDDLFRRFKKSVQTSGVLQECRKREHFLNDRELRIFKEKNNKKKKRGRK